MLVPHYEIRLSAAEQHALEALQRAGKTPQQTVRRVSILLLAHAGLSNEAIADRVGTARNLVQKWRTRFALYEPPLQNLEHPFCSSLRVDVYGQTAGACTIAL
ncbi:MAG: helix-turn-helix domain-containing protein [Thermodesulfobacteriota bacterium]|jgi:hypothetical protein